MQRSNVSWADVAKWWGPFPKHNKWRTCKPNGALPSVARNVYQLSTTSRAGSGSDANRRVARVTFALCVCAVAGPSISYGQLDPESRDLLQLGFNQSLRNDGPAAAYAFYYWNRPNLPTTNTTLRLAISPVFADGELGFKGLLGENTDLGVGLFGGAFFNDYHEVRAGNYYRDESFEGKGGGTTIGIYHLFNPGASIPLNGIVRGGVNYHVFSDTSDTADDFRLPRDQPFYTVHTGLRWGGKEPLLTPRLAMELAAWYDLEYRPHSGRYGLSGDRDLNSVSHRFLGSALLIYTTPQSEHYVMLGAMGGAVLNADRFSAHRLGGALPFTSEYPLYLPGYFHEELSTREFGLLYGFYSIPLGASRRWNVFGGGATAVVNYVDGLEQSGDWNSGVTGGLGYTSKKRRLKALGAFGYGINAIRDEGRGGYSAALMVQYNFGRASSSASDRAFEELQNARVPFRIFQ